MSFKLRFVQRFIESKREEFMELEKQFVQLENTIMEFPKGKRFVPYYGRESSNTLIWECEFETLQEAQGALFFLEQNIEHEKLYKKQAEYFLESYTEIYKMAGV